MGEDGREAVLGVRVRMDDTGTGISPELLDKIFEPFFTTKEQHGTGIGLWLSKQFVEDHKGTIEVVSSTAAEDHGTSFRIFLPYINGIDGKNTYRPGGNA